MLKITAIGNLTNDVELLSPRRAEEAAMAAEEPDSADAA